MSTPFQIGQIWRYRTRAGEEASRAYIVLAEMLDDDSHTPVFHLYLDGVRIANPLLVDNSGIQTTMPHIPVSLQTLQESLTELESSDQPMPDITEGWQQWKEAEGGIFTLPLADILNAVEAVIAQAPPLHKNLTTTHQKQGVASTTKASNKHRNWLT